MRMKRGKATAARPRICLVRQMSDYQPQVQRVAELLAGAGVDVEVICMKDPGRSRRTVENGVTVISLPASLSKAGKLRYVVDYLWFFLLVSALLAIRHARRPYAVIQIYTMPDFLVFAAAVPKLLGARVLAYMNEPSPELAETMYGSPRLVRLFVRIERAVLRFADRAITVTEQLKARYVERGAQADRISVVLNAADPVSSRAGWVPPPRPAKEEFVVISHGAIEERYGQDTILEAARLLREEIPSLRVVLTGAGSTVEQMLHAIHEWDLSDVVRFEGWVSRHRLNDLLWTADVGIVAQKASPYSHLVHTYKMVDFWIFGLPVVASRLRAVSETYDDTVIEYFEPGDPIDLARAIRRLYLDPERREELAVNGRLAEKRNGWSAQQRELLAVYRALLAERSSGQLALPDARPEAR